MIEIDGTKFENLHFKWDKRNKPVAAVDSGTSIRVTVPDSSVMQVNPNWTSEDLGHLDMSKLNGAVGPIEIKEAKKGDVLEVEVSQIEVADWGWSVTERSFGLIKGRFQDRLLIWRHENGFAESTTDFLGNVRVPLNPFFGIMGVAPEEGEYAMGPPQSFGGNMDNKLLTSGARLFLPVHTDGALFSVGDPHSAQGDGESGATGIETSAVATLKLRVVKGKPIRYPRALVKINSVEHLVAMGIADNLYSASQLAMESMIDELGQRGVSQEEAFILCSVAGDLRISELVDEPNHVVSMVMPVDVLKR